ncbi:unnamed protein product [Tilletia controversa]|nr:unnamed protein product [Tilletia controversa]
MRPWAMAATDTYHRFDASSHQQHAVSKIRQPARSIFELPPSSPSVITLYPRLSSPGLAQYSTDTLTGTFPTDQPPLCLFSLSAGSSAAGQHSLIRKLELIARRGFHSVELFQDDLTAFVESDEFEMIYQDARADSPPLSLELPQQETDVIRTTTFNAFGPCIPSQLHREVAAAAYIGLLSKSLGIKVASLQPLRDFEGWAEAGPRSDAFSRITSRFEVMHALGTDLLFICSNCQPADRLVPAEQYRERAGAELAELADLAKACSPADCHYTQPTAPIRPIRIGYEALSWGTHVDVWRSAWDIVETANRPQIGLVLDSFNTIGREWADPCSPSGISQPEHEADARLKASIEMMGELLAGKAEKIFFLQIADARRMVGGPLAPSPNETEPRPSRMIWSRSNRLFPLERELGAFLPVVDFVRKVEEIGYRGPWSVEVFCDSIHEKDDAVPVNHVDRGYRSLQRLITAVRSS